MKILFIDTVHPLLRSQLEAAGHRCEDGTTLSRDELVKTVGLYEGLVIRSRFRLDREIIDQAAALKFIARAGAGMENIDVPYAESKGIRCLHAPEGNRDAVGEHAMAMLLSLFTKLSKADREVREGQWLREENRGTELMGKTIAIIGFGNSGSAFARKLSGFDCRVLAYDKYKKDYGTGSVEETRWETILLEADIVSLHVPLTQETQFLINDEILSRFRKPVVVINTARGLCLHTRDLVRHMQKGSVSGACLDVLEYEDTSFESRLAPDHETWQYLVQSDAVVLSPHIAGWTRESNEKMARILFQKISAIAT